MLAFEGFDVVVEGPEVGFPGIIAAKQDVGRNEGVCANQALRLEEESQVLLDLGGEVLGGGHEAQEILDGQEGEDPVEQVGIGEDEVHGGLFFNIKMLGI